MLAYNDGGRAEAGFKGRCGDCGVRAMAIALGLPYKEVYRELAQANKDAGHAKSMRHGIYKDDYSKVLARHGWVWVSAPKFDGRKARYSDLPPGTHIARMARHFVAVIDGVVHDTFDCRKKMVYGYWTKPTTPTAPRRGVNTQEVPMDTIDNMIEDWAKARTDSTRVGIDAPLEGLEGFSLSSTPGTPLDAAHAVREAVMAKTGRRPKVDSWKPVAAKVLGISRLFAKRWQAVLDAGIEAGLFRIDSDTLSHPIIVPCEITEPEPVVVTADPRPKVKAEPDAPVDSGLPEGWKPPAVLPCGHTNWPHHGTTEDDPKQVAARADGFCCAAHAVATATHHRLNPGTKTKAALAVNWQVRGLHHPVPKALRRSPERQSGPGFPGLCCDPETGLYIGGVGNNCRHHHGGKTRCVVHGG